MTYKTCEIETNKKLIVHYDRVKPCRSPLGGFVFPTNTLPAPIRPPNEIPSNSSTPRGHSCSCEAHITCTITVGPVPVSSSVQTVQPTLCTTSAFPPAANDNPSEPSLPLTEDTFPNRSHDSTLPSSSQFPEAVNFTNLFLQHYYFLHVLS